MEDVNFIDLKTQFNKEKKQVLQADISLINDFNNKMNLMNKNAEISSKNVEEELSKLEITRNIKIC